MTPGIIFNAPQASCENCKEKVNDIVEKNRGGAK